MKSEDENNSPAKGIVSFLIILAVLGWSANYIYRHFESKSPADVKADNEKITVQENPDSASANAQDNSSDQESAVADATDNNSATLAASTNTTTSQMQDNANNSDSNSAKDSGENADENNNPSDENQGDDSNNDGDDNIDDPVTINRLVLDDFENESLDNWIGNAVISNNGFQSGSSLKLENEPLESIGAKRIFDMPILKGFEKIELDFKALPNSVGTGDASAIAFEQDGEWKWVSLSTYADSLDEDWQHLSIPLSDFVGLDTEKTVSNLTLRFWNYEKGEYYFDNIALTGQAQTSIARPEDLSGIAISESEISLSWLGNSSKYNIYQDNVLIGNTEITSYRVTNLEANTDYDFYVTAVNEGNESAPSNQCVVKTFENQVLPPLQSYIISNFDDQSLDGWTGEGSLIPSISDGFFLRLSNPENGAAGIDRVFDAAVAKGYQYLEFDINTNGTYFYDEAAQVCFDQNGWMPVSIMNYIDGRSSEWQHVKIPLSAFTGLDADAAIARMSFRFWDSMPGTIDIDNIAFN